MAGHHEVQKHGHGSHGLVHVLLKLFTKLKFFGLYGYTLEAVLELMHINKKVNHKLHFLHKPWMHLFAILMIIVGHLAEHVHQEEENHEQEARLKAIEDKCGLTKTDEKKTN